MAGPSVLMAATTRLVAPEKRGFATGVVNAGGSFGQFAMAPIAIGLTVFIAHLVLIPYTSCSINPSRSLGPAILSGTWPKEFWIFIFGFDRGQLRQGVGLPQYRAGGGIK